MKSKNSFSVAVIVGTRPELIKMAPILHELKRTVIKTYFIHTGQHYSPELDAIFLKDLRLPKPDMNLQVGSGTHGHMVSSIIRGVTDILLEKKPSVVLVQGDTNSALSGALAGVMANIPVAHVEAGLRSYDRTMPEETNRVAIDHVADILFAPTSTSRANLLAEGIPRSKIAVVGNTVVDAVQNYLPSVAEQEKTIDRYGLRNKTYALLTLHRPANVDDPKRLKEMLSAVSAACTPDEIYFPIHPRTRNQITRSAIQVPSNIHLIEPVGYFDMLSLIRSAELVITDSGGLQEETAILGVPCVTVRPNTERPETLMYGRNVLVPNAKLLPRAIRTASASKRRDHPFGKGDTGKQIVQLLKKKYG